jgi:hypothetical protein
MPLGKTFFGSRSQFAHAPQCATAKADADIAERESSKETGRRTISAIGFELTVKAVARCAACADLAFANLPVAILSWLLTQFFAGCAAYAEAMHPSIAYVREGEEADRNELLRSREPERGHTTRSPALAPDLKELSRFAIEDDGRCPAVQRAGRIRAIGAGSPDSANVVRLNVTPRAPSGRLVSITLIVVACLSKRRQPRGLPTSRLPDGNRPVAIELRNYDRRVLRRVGMPRYGIE